jgi:hypothetical protein
MKWTRLFLAQLRQSLRTPWSFVFLLLAIAVALGAGLRAGSPTAGRFAVGLINEDEGVYGSRLIAYLQGYPQLDLRPLPKEQALALLREDRLEAVFVVRRDYTERLRHNEYSNLIDWYTAPSSRAAATISEPLINGTMRLWIEEEAIANTREYLLAHGLAYPTEAEAAQRAIVQQVWQNRTMVNIKNVVLDNSASENGEAPASGLQTPADSRLAAASRWYAIFCVFYLVVSAAWVLDINKRGLRIRAGQTGARLWLILVGTSLAPLLIGMAGFWITGIICCAVSGGGWLLLLGLSLPVLLYLWTILGLTIALASFLHQTMALLFLAPLVTLVNALLSGLMAELPGWARMLAILSRALPGRWLNQSLASPLTGLAPALLCCGVWFLAGIAIAEFRRYRIYRGG